MKITAQELPFLLQSALKAQLVPMVHGSPASGKSTIIYEVAKTFNLKLIDIRLSQADPTELNGFPTMVDDKAAYIPMDTFPIEGDPLPVNKDGVPYNGWLIFFDELNSAPLGVQAASYKIILDRMVGQYNLHPNVAMAAAGNLATDKAIVNRLSTAMQSRMLHFELEVEHEAWIKWAQEHKIDHRIISFISFKPDILYNFNPEHNGYTYASPRTWEFTHKLIKPYQEEIPPEAMPLLAGAVGEYAAHEFYTYAQIFPSLITIPEIVANPLGIQMPNEPSVLFALSGAIGHKMSAANTEKLLQFVDRMDIEFQILAMQQGLTHNPDIRRLPAVKQWRTKYAKELFE